MLIEITSNQELIRLLGIDHGFLLNADYPAKLVRIHKINCKYCNPDHDLGLKPTTTKHNCSGEIWFSNNYEKVYSKAQEYSRKKGYDITMCQICNP